MITGIHHISLLISSEECLDFYKKLGFEETFRKERKADTVVLLEGYNIQLEVFIDNRHPKRVLDLAEPLGTRHFALKVDSVESTISYLQEQGIGTTDSDTGFDWTGIKYCYISDPDGNQIELHE